MVHLKWPNLPIDSITITLFAIAILPWLIPYAKSIEIPNILRIDLAEAKAAIDKITNKDVTVTPATLEINATLNKPSIRSKSDDIFTNLENISYTDPNLALVGFRIELEKKISSIFEKKIGSDKMMPLSRMVKILQDKNIIPSEIASGMKDLIGLGNKAAHGHIVELETAELVLTHGPRIFEELDNISNT